VRPRDRGRTLVEGARPRFYTLNTAKAHASLKAVYGIKVSRGSPT